MDVSKKTATPVLLMPKQDKNLNQFKSQPCFAPDVKSPLQMCNLSRLLVKTNTETYKATAFKNIHFFIHVYTPFLIKQ